MAVYSSISDSWQSRLVRAYDWVDLTTAIRIFECANMDVAALDLGVFY